MDTGAFSRQEITKRTNFRRTVQLLAMAVAMSAAVLASVGLKRAAAPIAGSQVQAADPSSPPPKIVPVYVSNFELDVVPLSPAQKLALAAANSAKGANPAQPGSTQEPPDPAKQASHLVDLMATKLVAALEKAGYPARRLRPGEGRPNDGVAIRGIFTEVDNENHWRRAVIRTGADTGKIEAMVALANLARPDQALYEIAHLPGNTNRPGAVITLSPYVPLQKYDVAKDAGEELFAKVASRVVADLTDFLKSNPAALLD